MSNFYTDFIVPSALFGSVSRVHSLSCLAPIFREKVEMILEESAAAGLPLMVFETYRSRPRQAQLYAQGATQLQTVGCHHFGVACDIIKSVGGDPSWKGDFSFLGQLANRHGLVWGGRGSGNLNIGDNDHIQWCAFEDQDELFNGTFYPTDDYIAWSPTIQGHRLL